ncbi:hypothetical protein SeMB42_g00353 [Synchytrium endobioticum]|uniref:Nucleolus and neural progenitor protein-like N-terminal domain-containing protein n=1 Tax=Synchytrium endobioticum TaxID=286115 RepID=A0A507DRD0_9FUNG|nr:hypothetical protein SeLEV6574_g00921 [Synchytrium endobioticum]TPX54289.1 hypothetical protein SeMB42_g00353 [Synchytrium endobioticum]
MNDWNKLIQLRNPPKPASFTDTLPIPHTSPNPAISTIPASPLPSLLQLTRALKGSELSADLFTFERTYYKNNNQHRTGTHWKKYQQLRRLIKRFQEVNLNDMIHDLMALMQPDKQRRRFGECANLPAHSLCGYVLSRLGGAYLLAERILEALIECYSAFRALLAQTLFMPTAMTMMAITSRLHILYRHVRIHIERCYALLRPFLELFPEKQVRQICVNFPLALSRMASSSKNISSSQDVTEIDMLESSDAASQHESNPEVEMPVPDPMVESVATTLSDAFFASTESSSSTPPAPAAKNVRFRSSQRKSKRIKVYEDKDEIDDIFG